MESSMVIYDNYRGARVLPDITVVAPEPESRARLWIVATVAGIAMFGVVSWWMT
jgi:hypothetical protein